MATGQITSQYAPQIVQPKTTPTVHANGQSFENVLDNIYPTNYSTVQSGFQLSDGVATPGTVTTATAEGVTTSVIPETIDAAAIRADLAMTSPSKPHSAYYLYVTPEGKVYDVSKEQGDQMIRNAVAQGYDQTVNGRVTPLVKNASGDVVVNNNAWTMGSYGTYVPKDPIAAITGKEYPGAEAITGVKDNTPVHIFAPSKAIADKAIAEFKARDFSNYCVETMPDDVLAKVQKVSDYYVSKAYGVEEMLRDFNPLNYEYTISEFIKLYGDGFAIDQGTQEEKN